jgi:hypothetical protein
VQEYGLVRVEIKIGMKIESLKFGEITIDGKKYHQIIIVGDEIIERNSIKLHKKFGTTHQMLEEEKVLLFKGEPKVVVIADGFDRQFEVSEDIRQKALEKKIELLILDTPTAVRKFNELKRHSDKINALFHTTC